MVRILDQNRKILRGVCLVSALALLVSSFGCAIYSVVRHKQNSVPRSSLVTVDGSQVSFGKISGNRALFIHLDAAWESVPSFTNFVDSTTFDVSVTISAGEQSLALAPQITKDNVFIDSLYLEFLSEETGYAISRVYLPIIGRVRWQSSTSFKFGSVHIDKSISDILVSFAVKRLAPGDSLVEIERFENCLTRFGPYDFRF